MIDNSGIGPTIYKKEYSNEELGKQIKSKTDGLVTRLSSILYFLMRNKGEKI